MTDFTTYPHVTTALRLDAFLECEEVLVSGDVETGAFETESAPFKLATIFEVNGDQHHAHRRLATPLFAKSALAFYEHDLLQSAIERCMAGAAAARGPSGPARADLVDLVRRMTVIIAATVIGLDGVESAAGTADLLRYASLLGGGADVKWSDRDHGAVVAEALEAKRGFVEDFYARSAARRQALIDRLGAGEASEADLPTDLITLMLRDDRERWGHDLMLREVIVYLTAGIRTTASAVTHTVDELHGWLTGHPEDRARLGDADFLRRCANEAIRLHPPSPALVRQAATELVLRSGRRVGGGQRIALDLVAANRDREVFGDDAHAFNPRRSLPRRYPPFGLSFGAGPHLCVGRPLVTTTVAARMADGQEMLRTIVRVLTVLYAAGVERDPDRPPIRAATAQDRYDVYPVVFTAL